MPEMTTPLPVPCERFTHTVNPLTPAPAYYDSCDQCGYIQHDHDLAARLRSEQAQELVKLRQEIGAARAHSEVFERQLQALSSAEQELERLRAEIERLKAEKERALDYNREAHRAFSGCEALPTYDTSKTPPTYLAEKVRWVVEQHQQATAQLAALTARHEPLTALMAQWRVVANATFPGGQLCMGNAGAAIVKACADELEAALLAALPSGGNDENF